MMRRSGEILTQHKEVKKKCTGVPVVHTYMCVHALPANLVVINKVWH